MKGLIKLFLLGCIAIFALVNYRVFSFNKGFSQDNLEDKTVIQVISTVTGIEKVEYYERTISDGDYIYNVYIETNEEAYLLKATQKDIDAFKTLGIFAKNIKPEKISPIPFYVEIVLGLIVLFIPFGERKSEETPAN